MPLDTTRWLPVEEDEPAKGTSTVPATPTAAPARRTPSTQWAPVEEAAPAPAPAPAQPAPTLAETVAPPSPAASLSIPEGMPSLAGNIAPDTVAPAPAPAPPEAPPAASDVPVLDLTPENNASIQTLTPSFQPAPPPSPGAVQPGPETMPPGAVTPTPEDNPSIASLFQPVVPGSDTRGGPIVGAQRGLADMLTESWRLQHGEAFAPSTPPEPPPDLNLMGRVAYGITHSSPTLAAGVLGAAGGTAAGGPLGGVAGGALGYGLVGAVQALIPGYDEAIRQGLPHDQAVDYAIRTATMSGAVNAATAPLFAIAPFKSAVANILLHTVATGPATSAGARFFENAAAGKPPPTLEELAQAGLEGGISAGVLTTGHVVGRQLAGLVPKGRIPLRPGNLQEPPEPGQVALAAPEGGLGPGSGQGGEEQLPAPAKQLPAPGEGQVQEQEPTLGKTDATPDQAKPIAPVPSPLPGPPDTGAGEGSSLPGAGQGQTGVVGGPQGGQVQPQPEPKPSDQEPSVTPVGGGGVSTTEPTPQPKTQTPGGPGTTQRVTTNVPDTFLDTHYRVVEANSLVPASGALQPRDRAGRAASEAQIAEMAGRLDPARVGASPVAELGAPVTSLSGDVLAGNGRLAAINRAAEQHPDRYQAYKDALTDLGHDISGFDRPILVRQADKYLTEDEGRKFAEASNVPAAMSMSPVEQAKVDARNLSDDTLAKYNPDRPLTSPANQSFMRDFVGSLPATERNRLQDDKGNLSVEGVRRIQGAVLAKAYEHDPLLTRALESPVDDVKSITGTLMDVAAPYVKLKSEIRQDRLPKELDITHNITQALDLVNQARAKGLAPGDMLKQGDIFSGAKLDPVTEQVIRTFYNDNMTRLRSRPRMTEVLREYVSQALSYKPGKDLFGEEQKADPAELLRQARGGGQGDLGIAAESKIATDEPQQDELPVQPKQELAKTEDAAGDEGDTELEDIDQMSPDELFDEDIAASNTAIARIPSEQAELDRVNEQIVKLEANIERARGANKSANTIQSLEAQLGKQIRRREDMTSGVTSEQLEARVRPGQFRPTPSRKPLSPYRKRGPMTPPTALDYQFGHDGKNVWQTAFADAGEDPNLALSRPLTWQIETLRRQTQKQFGLKSVTVDEKMDKLEARDILLQVYRAASDGMTSLGYPPDAFGIFKTIGLMLERYQPNDPKKNYAGTFHTGDKIIRLTTDANSLGHEWTHALDNWLLDQLKPGTIGNLATVDAEASGGNPNDDMAQRLGRVMQVLFYDEAELAARIAVLQAQAQRLGPSAQAAQQELDQLLTGAHDPGIKGSRFRRMGQAIDQLSPKPYYGTIYELIARAHEAYISRVMTDAGVDPRGFVMQEEGYLTDTVHGLSEIYPKDTERTAIFNAFDHLHYGLRNLLMTGTPKGLFSNKDLSINLDNYELNKRLPPGAMNALKRALAETVADVKEWRVSLALTPLYNKDRPKPNYSLLQRIQKGIAKVLGGSMGELDVMYAMADPKVKPYLRQIMSMLGTTPGTGYAQSTPSFEERYQKLAKQWSNKYVHIMDEHGLDRRGIKRLEMQGFEVDDMLHHAMTTEGPVPDVYKGTAIPGQIKQAAGPLRVLMEDIFRSLRDAGADIQYSKNGYFPRVYDHVKIWSDPQRFKRDAHKLFKRMFDDEVGPPGDNPEKLLAAWRRLSVDARGLAPQDVQDAMVDLAKILRKLKALPKLIAQTQQQLNQVANDQLKLTPKQVQNLHNKLAKRQALVTSLTQDAEDLAQQYHDPVGNHIASLGAEEWRHRVAVGYQTDFDTIGPSGAFLNHRKLPPAADDIMKDWLITEPNTALLRYFQSAARKQAFIEILGPNQQKFEDMLTAMDQAGAPAEDIRLIRGLANIITGRGNFRDARGMIKGVQFFKAFAATSLLGASYLAMIGEPMVSALSLRSFKAPLKAYVNQLAAQFNTATAQERAEIADMIGATTHAIYDDIIMNREGTDYADTPQIAATMGRIYRMIGQTNYNSSNRRAMLAGVNWYLTKLANDWLAYKGWRGAKRGAAWRNAHERGERAHGWLNDLGVPENETLRRGFAEWMVSHDGVPGPGGQRALPPPSGPGGSRKGSFPGRLPRTFNLQNSEWRPTYELAIGRLLDRTVMNPKRGEVPELGLGPIASMITQFQSFSFAIQRQVLDPALKALHQRYDRGVERAITEGRGRPMQIMAGTGMALIEGTQAVAGAAAMITAQIPGAVIRLAVYHPDVFTRELENGTLGEYVFDYALNQSGLNGAFSMPLQAISQIRYDSSLGGMFEGPGVSRMTQGAADIIQAFSGGGESNTNTRIYKGIRATYNTLLVPAMAYGLSRLSGGFGPFATFAAGLTYSMLSSRPASDTVATTLVNEKGTKLPPPEKEGLERVQQLKHEIETLKHGGIPSRSEMMGGGQQDPSDSVDHGFTSMVPWGIMDDFAVPIARKLVPAIARLPPSVIKTAAVGTAAAFGYWFLSETEPFRSAEPPSATGPPK